MHELTKLIRDDMKPALGVTEPGAIAFAVARARAETKGELRRIVVALNSGMYKNAYTCGIPNSPEFGNLYAAALGAVAADASLGLESLAHITGEDNDKARQLVEAGLVEVRLDHMGSRITIDAAVETDTDSCTVHIRDSHTDIRWIEKNGTVIFGQPETGMKAVAGGAAGEALEAAVAAGVFGDAAGSAVKETAGAEGKSAALSEKPAICRYRLRELLEYVRQAPAEELAFIREAFPVNMELLEEGLRSPKTTIGPLLLRENGGQLISEDAQRTAQLLCGGAIEARVLGLAKPAMSITGSGAHGIIATMPLYAYYRVKCSGQSDSVLCRATALSFLVTMYIKEYSGRLSAFCGCGIAAGTGMACGLGFLQEAGEQEMDGIIRNMASGLTGMICDGGNQGCAMKGIVAVDAAFRAVDLAMAGVSIGAIHGINGRTPEDTMRNMGRIASPGMEKTEEVIVEIMEQK